MEPLRNSLGQPQNKDMKYKIKFKTPDGQILDHHGSSPIRSKTNN